MMKKQQCGSGCFKLQDMAMHSGTRGGVRGFDSRFTPTLSCNLGSLMV